MGKLKDIKNAIVTALEAITIGEDSTEETVFAEVVSDTRASFSGYPAARVILNGQPNEFSTNRQNERTAEYLIISYVQYEANDANAEGAAFDLAYDINDLVVDKMDALEPGFTVITQPTQSGWEIIETEAGNVLSIMATVRIGYSHDIV